MAEARQVAGLKLAVKPDGKIEIDWSSGKLINCTFEKKMIINIFESQINHYG